MSLFSSQNDPAAESDDDISVPASLSSSTGSTAHEQVLTCGNRVLDIISRHINDVRNRKNEHDKEIKEMLLANIAKTQPAENANNRKVFDFDYNIDDFDSTAYELSRTKTEGITPNYMRVSNSKTPPSTFPPQPSRIPLLQRSLIPLSPPKCIDSEEYMELPPRKLQQNFPETSITQPPIREIKLEKLVRNANAQDQVPLENVSDIGGSSIKNHVRFEDSSPVKRNLHYRAVNKQTSQSIQLNHLNHGLYQPEQPQLQMHEKEEENRMFQPVEECLCGIDAENNNNLNPLNNTEFQHYTDYTTPHQEQHSYRQRESPMKKQNAYSRNTNAVPPTILQNVESDNDLDVPSRTNLITSTSDMNLDEDTNLQNDCGWFKNRGNVVSTTLSSYTSSLVEIADRGRKIFLEYIWYVCTCVAGLLVLFFGLYYLLSESRNAKLVIIDDDGFRWSIPDCESKICYNGLIM